MPASSNISATSKTPTTLPPAAPPISKTSSKEAPVHKIIGHKPTHKPQPIQNRIKVLLVHIPKFSIQGQARLAAEVGVSRTTISRLIHGRINPSYRLARGVTDVLERMLGKPLDMREVFSTDGTYLTPSGCALCRCHGCLPDVAWDEDGHLKPGWEDARPGDWSLARADTLEPEWENRQNEELGEEELGEEEPCEQEANGGFSGYGEYEDGDEEANAEHWQAKLEAAKLREASTPKSVTPKSAKSRDLQGSAR